MDTRLSPQRTLIGISIAVVLLLTASGGIALLRPAPAPKPGTPGATAVELIEAVVDGDDAHAQILLSPEFSARCEVELTAESPSEARIRDVSVEDDTAKVEIGIAFRSSDLPFVIEEWSSRTTISMALIDGVWLISDEPWELFNCRGGT